HQSLALLEYFVHLDKDDPPGDLVLAIAEVPDDLSQERVEVSHLPANWRVPVATPELAWIGDEFVRKGEHCLVLVPSVVVPDEHNWLINPGHPEFKRIVIRAPQPLAYDPRMFGTKRRRPRQ
ncbi:MAG TPA: RES domain-containing protein, partial [Candidatus Dormibacteraeota bacterium]|nr:RES domain-containing protein [Candidatus Dormibacteraeota bacterium]